MTHQECWELIKDYSRAALCDLWEDIKKRVTEEKGWPKGLAFEYLILKAFQLEEADVIRSFPVKVFDATIEQIDGVVHLPGTHLSLLIESKDYQESISIDPIVKMRSQLQRRPTGVVGAVFSVNGFTDPALTLAQFMAPQTILLWDQQDIEYCLLNGSFVNGFFRKYRYCIEQGKPDYNLADLSKLKQ